MERLARWGWRRLGVRYFTVYLTLETCTALAISVATIGLLALYEPLTGGEFLRIALVISALTLISARIGAKAAIHGDAGPLYAWARGDRGREGAVEAWRAAVSAPRQFVVRSAWQPVVLVAVPMSFYITLELDLPAYSQLILLAGGCVAIAYSAILHFFGSELALRPVLQDIAQQLPRSFSDPGAGVPLRWKLLGSLPLINVITGVAVSGLSTRERAALSDLGLDVVVAVLVAFTVSFELTLLLTRSIVAPVRELLEATGRVREGDLSARVALTSGDELGQLAHGFNQMLDGLEERERLREAFGSYVSPDVAQRVLEEGELLRGEDVEVTVLFVDICDFTSFAERASARETVAYLNDFFGLVVPVLDKHGGHANKFIGDGVLGVFGVPERHGDHAGRALAAAVEIASLVDERYGDSLRVGIGLNSGPVSVGSVGGGGRLEFTVIGDAVNVAARVEKLTRSTGDTILFAEGTRALLPRDVGAEPRGEVTLRGKSDPMPVYAPVAAGRRARPAVPAGGAAGS
jgi:class 3 adenylate cyclase